MTFVLFSFLHGTRYLFICTKYVALRAALESTVRGAVAPQTSSSSLLLFLFFGTIFRNAQPIILRYELQDHAGSPREIRARLPHYRRLLKLPRSI